MALKGLDIVETLAGAIKNIPRLMSRASRDAAEELEDVIEQQFDLGLDPYGREWAELRPSTLRRGRTPPPLTDTEALRAVHVAPSQSSGVVVEFSEPYASYHQTGTSKMAQRRIVPEDGELPDAWYHALVIAYSNAIVRNGGWRALGCEIVVSGGPPGGGDSADMAAEE